MTTIIHLHLFRHGDVEGDPALYGWTDVESSKEGQHKLLSHLEHSHTSKPFDGIYASPLKRTCAPAREFAKTHALPFLLIENVKELHFGDWDGVAFDHFDTRFQSQPDISWPLLTAFYASPYEVTPPNGEPLAAFCTRVETALVQLLHDSRANNFRRVALVTHAGVIRALFAQILGIKLSQKIFGQLHVDYASQHSISFTLNDDELSSASARAQIHQINQLPPVDIT